ncbi:hypothetical protein AMTR_s00036p00185270 [Amborella trichopoda]|uniref:Uncharacterized protein n=1 Tax=Amborella trichopoda TaxID=13333 RepID=U5CQC4_AMBTC|nr:hypothetical protein AMTR_s00036p00185270 [Amborella trichopoda]
MLWMKPTSVCEDRLSPMIGCSAAIISSAHVMEGPRGRQIGANINIQLMILSIINHTIMAISMAVSVIQSDTRGCATGGGVATA